MLSNLLTSFYAKLNLTLFCTFLVAQTSLANEFFTASIDTPLNNSVMTGPAAQISASIQFSTSISRVVFYRDSWIEMGSSTSFPYTLSIDTSSLADGGHTFFAIATNQDGGAAATSVVSVEVSHAKVFTINLTSPTSAATLSGSQALISASIQSSSPISKVVFYRDNWVEIGTTTSTPYNLVLDTRTLANGNHNFFAVAINSSAESMASGMVAAQIQNLQTLIVNIVSPSNAAVLSGPSAVIAASVQSSNTISKVVFYRDNWIEIATVTLPPYQAIIDTNSLANGGHSFFSVVTDSQGTTSASSIVSTQVQNSAPVIIPAPPIAIAPTPAPAPAPAPTPLPTPVTVPSNPAGSAVCKAGAVVGWDPLPTFKKSYISSGQFAGAYTVGPAGYLNWYFSSLGILGFIDRLPLQETRQYLDSYMANLEKPSVSGKGYNIQDITFANPYQTSTSAATKKAQDSDDSYAATILSVASRYIACSNDTAWLNEPSKFGSGETNLQVLKKIADFNLVETTKDSSTGLVHTFQDLKKYAMYYTEDNAEAYKGLVDFSRLLSSIGDNQSQDYALVASGIAYAINNILFINQIVPNLMTGSGNNISGYALGYSGIIEPITNNFYPGAVTHLFPTALGVPISAAHASSAVDALNKTAPNWCNQVYDASGRDPFMILGYASAVLGDRTSAQCQLDFYARQAQLGTATITVSGLGFYQRTVNVLQGNAPY